MVTASVDSLAISGTSNRSDAVAPSDAELKAMLSVTPTSILDGTENTDTLTWNFNSSSEAFDYLATDETLILEYLVKATDDDGTLLSDTETVTITITGTNDAPIIDLDDSTEGNNYETTFNENSSAISIVGDDITITDYDGTTITSASLTFTNSLSGDVLDITALDAKFGAVLTGSAPGVITVDLSGEYSLADYEAAIQSITFVTALEQPVESDRTINITLEDDMNADSLEVTSTIHVNAKPDLLDNSIDVVEGSTIIDQNTDDGNGSTVEGNLLTNDETGTPGGEITGFQYFNESGDSTAGTIGVEADTQYGAITVNADGTWQYTSDPWEKQTDTTTPNDNIPQDIITYTFTDGNGDAADADLVINVLDGENPTIAPVDQTVNEEDLGYGVTLTPVTVTETLTVGQGTDPTNTKFTETQVSLEALSLASNGVALVYTITDDVITAKAGTTTVFEVTLTARTTESAGYDFKLHQPIDHTVTGATDTVWELPFDVIVVDEDDNGVTAGDSANGQFVVSVTDSKPFDAPQTITTDEDTAITLRVSQEALSVVKITALDGVEQTVATNASTPIYDQDGTTVIGQLFNKGDGTFTFTPDDNYSNYNYNPTFDYVVTDFDGDTSPSTTVSIVVNPVADAPVWLPHAGVETPEDTMVDLNLTLPTIIDNTDQNLAGVGDHAERLGYISLTSVDTGAEVYKADGTTLLFTGANNTMSIVIVTSPDVLDTSVHHSDLILDSAIQLTQAEFELLKILPAVNVHSDLDMTLNVTSYEVDDSGNKLVAVTDVESTRDVHVEVLAVTDTPTLTLTPASYTIDEDTTLTLTTDLVEGLDDTDGSESIWYELIGLVEGSIVTIGGNTYTADVSGNLSSIANKITVDEVGENPAFTITPPENYSGDMGTVTIMLKVQDSDSDSTTAAPTTLSTAVSFTLSVDPIADVMLLEDIAMVEDTPSLLFASLATTETDDSESITKIVINALPDGWVLKDEIGGIVITGNDVLNATIDVTSATLANVQNYTLTPPPHSSADIELNMDITVLDVESGRPDSTVSHNHAQIVIVSPVAEQIAVDGQPSDTDGDGNQDVITQGDHSYTTTAEEDVYFNLNTADSGFGLTVNNEDTAEKNSVLFTPKDGAGDVLVGTMFTYTIGGDVTEIRYNGVSGVPVEIPAAGLDSLQVKPPFNFSGTLVLTTEIKTVDLDDDVSDKETASEATSPGDTLTITVIANIDAATISLGQVVLNEDATDIDAPENGAALNIKVTSNDPSETFNVTIDAIPDGGAVFYLGSLFDETGLVAGYPVLSGVTVDSPVVGNWKITIDDYNNDLPPQFIPPHNSDTNYAFVVSSTTTDGLVTGGATADFIRNVSVLGVADIPVNDALNSLDETGVINADTGLNIYSAVVAEDNAAGGQGAEIVLSTLYNSPGLVSYDSDGSESLSIVITGLAPEFTVTGATSIGGVDSDRKWVLDESQLDSVKVVTAQNYSGEIDFTLTYITTERGGDSQTHAVVPVSVLVTPVAEGAVNLTTAVDEDTLTLVNFSVVQQNAETAETVNSVWINIDDVSGKEFTLFAEDFTSHGSDSNVVTLAEAAADTGNIEVTIDGTFYKLTGDAINSVFVQYDADIGSSLNTGFGIKYTTEDVALTTNGSVSVNDVLAETTATYSLVLSAVTDDITVNHSAIVATVAEDITVDGNDVTVNNNTTISVTLDISGVDTADEFTLDNGASTNNLDTDGSEFITRIVVEGVPIGVRVEGGFYGGDSVGGDTGVWYVDIADIVQDNITEQYTLNLIVDGDDATYVVANAPITITVYNQEKLDGEVVASEESGVTNVNLIKADVFVDGGAETGGVPIVINPDGFVENEAFAVYEDTNFNLAEIINVSVDNAGASDTFSITVEGLQNATLTGTGVTEYEVAGETVYILTATGDENAIRSQLGNIIITPDLNYNQNNAGGTTLGFTATLTTYAPGGEQDTMEVTIVEDVIPVTDLVSSSATLTYLDENGDVSAEALEDGSYSIAITLNTVDNPDFSYVQGAADSTPVSTLTVTHDSGIYGTLSWSGGSVVFDATTTTAAVPFDQVGALTFEPAENEAGNVTLSCAVFSQETDATNITSSTGLITVDVQPVGDGLTLPELGGLGDEDSYIELLADLTAELSLNGAVLEDPSESITTLMINGVPDGFLIFLDDNHSTLAQNTGDNGVFNDIPSQGFDLNGTEVGFNQWNIDVSGGIPQVWLKAPENWSDATPIELTLITYVSDGGDILVKEDLFEVMVNPSADDLTLNPIDSFGLEGGNIPINLNLSMEDVDGSETVSFTLTGLPEGVIFTIGGDIHPSEEVDGTYTITAVAYENLNDIVATMPEGVKGDIAVDVSAWTVDGGSHTELTPQGGSFALSLTQHASGVTEYSVLNGSVNNIAAAGAEIPLVISGLDLADKDGSETLAITISGLSAGITLDVPVGMTATQDGSDWIIELGAATDIGYAANLAALENGDLTLITSGDTTDSITVFAYSTVTDTGETLGVETTLNLTVDATDSVDGTAADETLYASDSGDTLNSFAGIDFLYGGLGDDILVGGADVDTLEGGAGADVFKMTTDDLGSSDIITDFENGTDLLDLSDILEGSNLITDADSLNEYLAFTEVEGDVQVIIDSNGETTSGGVLYEITLQNTSIADIDENDIID